MYADTCQSRVAHHGPAAVIDLCLLAGSGDDHHAGFGSLRAAQLAHEALHALVAAGEAVLIDQVLPDRYRVAASAESRSMASRYGSQALALGLRCGEATDAEGQRSLRLVGMG